MISHSQIILASKSKGRQDMLRGAGIEFQAIPADIDEAIIQNDNALSPEEKAQRLAREKALYVANSNNDAYVIGSDQILELDGHIFSKAQDKAGAIEKLKTLRGKSHRLISAVSVVRGGAVVWETYDAAVLTMHDFDDDFLMQYADKADFALTGCVGAYALESVGSWLFEKVEGDFFTVLGMPLLPLLSFLRTEGLKP